MVALYIMPSALAGHIFGKGVADQWHVGNIRLYTKAKNVLLDHGQNTPVVVKIARMSNYCPKVRVLQDNLGAPRTYMDPRTSIDGLRAPNLGFWVYVAAFFRPFSSSQMTIGGVSCLCYAAK